MVERYKNKVIIVGCGPWIEGVYFSQGALQRQKGRYPGGEMAFVKTFSRCRCRKNRRGKELQHLVNRIADWSSRKQVVVLVTAIHASLVIQS